MTCPPAPSDGSHHMATGNDNRMRALPLITGFGGINAAGRSGGHHAYRRLVIDALPEAVARETWQGLAALTGCSGPLDAARLDWLASNTLVRRIGHELFDTEHIPMNRRMTLH